MTPRKPSGEHLPSGRPTKFRLSMLKLVKKLAAAGMTEREIASCLEITPKTLHNWKADHPKLARALMPGKQAANQRVEASLYHRAVGYSYDVTRKIEKPSKVKGEPPEVLIVTQEVHYPPAEGAMTLWLTNRLKKRWKSRQSTELTTPPGQPLEIRNELVPAQPEILETYYATLARIAEDHANRQREGHSASRPQAGDLDDEELAERAERVFRAREADDEQ